MELRLVAPNGITLRPAKLALNLLHSLPDRPAGVQELCPTACLDAEVIATLGNAQSVDTITGFIESDLAAWMVVSMRRDDIALVMALDLGDTVIQRWLADAPADGPVVGLWSPAAARAMRLPDTDALRQVRRRSFDARPAGRHDKGQLFDRLLDCIESGELSVRLGSAGGTAQQVHLALQLADLSGGVASDVDESMVQ